LTKLVSVEVSSTAPACSIKLGDSVSIDGMNDARLAGTHSNDDSSSQFPPARVKSAASARLTPHKKKHDNIANK
jgi:hypothetical protein